MKKSAALTALLVVVALVGFVSGKRAADGESPDVAAPAVLDEPEALPIPTTARPDPTPAAAPSKPAEFASDRAATVEPLTGEMLAALEASVEARVESEPYLRHGREDTVDAEGAYVQYQRWSECAMTASLELLSMDMARVAVVTDMANEYPELQERVLEAMEVTPARESGCDEVTYWEAVRQRYGWLEQAVLARYPLAFLEFVKEGREYLLDLELRQPGYLDRYRSTGATALTLGVRAGTAQGFLAYAEAMLAEELLELDDRELLAYATAAEEAQRVLDVAGSSGRVTAFHYDVSQIIEIAEARLPLEEIRDARARGRGLCDRYCYARD